MAITQISRVQVRRGLNQDLPQLASAELGWSLDTRQLYIGNGLFEEGAPEIGVTEILTEHSNILNKLVFAGTESGWTSQTGPDRLHPIQRTLEDKLDNSVNVRDFGAIGDGLTDDTDAIIRAVRQIYVAVLNGTHSAVRRTIKFPAGTYLIGQSIALPPNCVLVGDGKNNTILAVTSGAAITTCDIQFQRGIDIGVEGALPPSYISVKDMQLQTLGAGPVCTIDSAVNVTFDNVYFLGGVSVNQLVTTTNITPAPITNAGLIFNNCVFDGAQYGFVALSPTIGVKISNSTFKNIFVAGIDATSNLTGLVDQNNYFDTTVITPFVGITGNNYSYGSVIAKGDIPAGIYSGSARFNAGQTVTLSSGTTLIKTLTSGSGTLDYEIKDSSSNFRFGTLKYNLSNGVASFEEEYSEPAAGLNANVFVDASGTLTCSVTNASTFKYNIKQFV